MNCFSKDIDCKVFVSLLLISEPGKCGHNHTYQLMRRDLHKLHELIHRMNNRLYGMCSSSKYVYISISHHTAIILLHQYIRVFLPNAEKSSDHLDFTSHTFETPTLCYLVGTPDESLAIVRCSENERHGCTLPKLLCTLHWWQKPGWLGIQYTTP